MWGLGMMIFGALFWLVLMATIVVGIWALLGQRRPLGRFRLGEDRALQILRERYARGEITREEFEALRRDLTA